MARGKVKEKHVLVRMPAELHEIIIALAKMHRRSINSEIVDLLDHAAEWWEDINNPDNRFSDGQLYDMEATAKKMWTNIREQRLQQVRRRQRK
jgi:Arc-like DNA binding domain